MADNKQIYQFPNNPTPQLTDLVPQSNESAAHETVQSTWQQILSLLQSNIQISESQVTNLIADLASKVNKAGDTMTGALILNADPVLPLGAVTKQYVDAIVPGASIAWAGIWSVNNNFSQSFTDAGTFKGIRVDNLHAIADNFIVTLDGSDQVYAQYIGSETAQFRIGLTNRIRTKTNTNPNSYNYSVGVDAGAGIVPIFSGAALMPFVTGGSSDLDAVIVPYNITLLLNSGDKVYPIINNNGDLTPANNEYIARNLLIDIQKIEPVGGISDGVDSANGLTGDITWTSSNGSITVSTTPGNIDLSANLPAGFYAPSVSILAGASSVTVQSASYDSTSPEAGGRVSCNAVIDVSVDGSGSLVQLLLPGPIAENFTATSQSGPIGFGIVPAAGVGVPGNVGSGWFNQLYAYTPGPNSSILFFEAANISTTYRINVAWSYVIQPAPLELKESRDLIYGGMEFCSSEFKKILENQKIQVELDRQQKLLKKTTLQKYLESLKNKDKK